MHLIPGRVHTPVVLTALCSPPCPPTTLSLFPSIVLHCGACAQPAMEEGAAAERPTTGFHRQCQRLQNTGGCAQVGGAEGCEGGREGAGARGLACRRCICAGGQGKAARWCVGGCGDGWRVAMVQLVWEEPCAACSTGQPVHPWRTPSPAMLSPCGPADLHPLLHVPLARFPWTLPQGRGL